MTADSARREAVLRPETSVTAVVVNYRTADSTLRCVESLQRLSSPMLSVLVVDNDSRDGSFELLRTRLPAAQVLPARENLGYGHGNNLGIRSALERGAEFIWVLTPDVEVGAGTLGPLLRLMANDPRVGIAGSIVHAGELRIVRSLLTPNLGYLPRHVVLSEREAGSLHQPIETDYVEGCAILLRAAMVEEIGLFRDDWFLYFEEAEYCLRARERGWRVRIAPDSEIRTRPITDSRNDRAYYMVRNSILLARSRRSFRCRTVARHLAALVLNALRIRRDQEYASATATLKAILAGLRKPLAQVPSAR